MFQFRPFPSYAYLIQRTMTKYCLVGFPHSEIHGYSGYLLLPVAYRSLSRPSSAPDAKAFPLRSFQLDLLVAKSACLRFRQQPSALAENCARSLAPRFPRTNACAGLREEGGYAYDSLLSQRSRSLEIFGSLKNYAGNSTEDFSKLLPFTFYGVVPQLKLKTFFPFGNKFDFRDL